LRLSGVLITAVLWLALVAPLTTLGFGSDTDAWLVADVSDYIVAQRQYLRSRTTGFPLFELAATPLVQIGNWQLSNLLALASGLALFVVVARLGRAGHYRHPALVLVTLLFLPVIVKNASVTMDYIPALALLIAAYACLMRERWTMAGVLIGIATGVRLSSLCLALPAAVYAWRHTQRVQVGLTLAGGAALVGLVAFLPSLRLGGFGIVATMPWMKGVYNGLRLFGPLQTVALAILLWIVRGPLRVLLSAWRHEPLVLFHLLVIGIWLLLFLPLPDEPEYLLPAVPSLIWILDRVASRRQFALASVILMSYHLVSLEVSGTRGGTQPMRAAIAPGFTVADIQDRRFKMALRDAATHWTGTAPTLLMEQALAVVTRNPEWVLDPAVNEYRQRQGHLYVSLRYYRAGTVSHFRDHGLRIVVLQQREFEFHQPGRDTAWPFIDFISREDLDRLLGRRIPGRPLS
jgi:hypothetical protein